MAKAGKSRKPSEASEPSAAPTHAPAADSKKRKRGAEPEPEPEPERPVDAKRSRKLTAPDPSSAGGASGSSRTLTVESISADALTALAAEHWAPGAAQPPKPFDREIIETIFASELCSADGASRARLLELSQYLERYLWPNFGPGASRAHVLSIAAMVSVKAHEALDPWAALVAPGSEAKFAAFFVEIMALPVEDASLCLRDRLTCLSFACTGFVSLERAEVREQFLRLVSLPLWRSLPPQRASRELAQLFAVVPHLAKHWKKLEKLAAAPPDAGAARMLALQESWLPHTLEATLATLEALSAGTCTEPPALARRVVERAVALLIDLTAQLPTRRFANTFIQASAFLVRARAAAWLQAQPAESATLRGQLDLLGVFARFPIDDLTGEATSEAEVGLAHGAAATRFQHAVFAGYPELNELALCNMAALQDATAVRATLARTTTARLRSLAVELGLVAPADFAGACGRVPDALLADVLVDFLARPPSQRDAINALPLLPTEADLYHPAVDPPVGALGDDVLALPKLNVQFLTLYDYLLRSFHLYRLESMYEIRSDIEDAVRMLDGAVDPEGTVHWRGWARMALVVQSLNLANVGPPELASPKPREVRLDVGLSLTSARGHVRAEWDALRRHDIVFLVTLAPRRRLVHTINGLQPDPEQQLDLGDASVPFAERYGVVAVRGGEIDAVLDEAGDIIAEESSPAALRQLMAGTHGKASTGPQLTTRPKGSKRTLRLLLDTAQYQTDAEAGRLALYGAFTIVVRRQAKENNFKAVLHTVRALMNKDTTIPPWLADTLLGYGDPASACYRSLPNALRTMDLCDTFLSWEHVQASFPGRVVEPSPGVAREALVPPFTLTLANPADASCKVLVAPSPAVARPVRVLNSIAFTPKQVEAILAGVQVGLNLVVGPPGTGKTDVAVQIVNCLYHNFPAERVLLVTHSNQALNALFAKIAALDIDPADIVRLGHGADALGGEADYSKYGRVDYLLGRRQQALAQAAWLYESLGLSVDLAFTIETATAAFRFHVATRWAQFSDRLVHAASAGEAAAAFPFSRYFGGRDVSAGEATQALFRDNMGTLAAVLARATQLYGEIVAHFNGLEALRPVELLRSGVDRANHLVTSHARIVAMTCTHAALKWSELVQTLGFTFDSIVLEEAAQIMDVETMIPLVLQDSDLVSGHRLRRITMIGDHHQLPPVVKNTAFQAHGHLDQSMFARFVRLQVPRVQLDMQGRMRPSLRALWGWRYEALTDLPLVTRAPEFSQANAGFAHTAQLIDVPDYLGAGESTPSPHYFQNLGEAEYVVAVFQYMRLLGYPASAVAILTTYNGQRSLIEDVLQHRCAGNPLFGMPAAVSTVDKFQGQQADYVLLSLVRTRSVGHLRDVRRLVVAFSRARLGLYVFCRVSLFANCFELSNAFNPLMKRPAVLQLAVPDRHPSTSRAEGEAIVAPAEPTAEPSGPVEVVDVADVAAMGLIVYNMGTAAQALHSSQAGASETREAMQE